MLDKFCQKMGIGENRQIISSKGRRGVVSGIEYCPVDNGKVWVMVDGLGAIRIPQNRFIKPPQQNAN